MHYPVLIEKGTDDTAFGVIVPDLPGCFSAGDSLDEALDSVREAASAWIDAALDAGQQVPLPSNLDNVRRLPAYHGWSVGMVNIETCL